jgi:hypothetical protein
VQKPVEAEFLNLLADRLKVPADEAKSVMDAAAERAKKLLHYL